MVKSVIPIQINQNHRIVQFATIKIFVLINSGKFSGKFSSKLPTVIFNQLSDAIFDKENNFLAIMNRLSKVNL